ncbi:PDZ domain-containing protein [Leifsonia kafniensis]|uniref:endopeptidase La n=1 Tax=Leifsonia kafniensis TaxID=475957 RepID=A0ABP7KBS5_9MICO
MALFTDDHTGLHGQPSRRLRAGWIVLLIAVLCGLLLAIVPSPYVVEQPGPVFNTLGSAKNADGKEVPLITISDEKTYPTDGSLNMLTVSVVGNPDQRLNWLTVAGAWFDSTKAVVPLEAVFPPNVTTEQRNTENEAAMVDSQKEAVAAALTHQGISYSTNVAVMSLTSESPATGILKPDDQIISVNGTPITDISSLRAALKANGAGQPATIAIVRDGKDATVEVTPVEQDGAVIAGINVKTDYEFPFPVSIQLNNVGGPSAGMMFALGIIDKLTPESLTGGADIAGTGTIDPAGTVGPIGGIQQKMFGAKGAGAKWFLAPASNCNEVTGHIPDGLRVFSVTTLDEAVTALDAISSGKGLDALPTCPVS